MDASEAIKTAYSATSAANSEHADSAAMAAAEEAVSKFREWRASPPLGALKFRAEIEANRAAKACGVAARAYRAELNCWDRAASAWTTAAECLRTAPLR
jgi:hypothetical protein